MIGDGDDVGAVLTGALNQGLERVVVVGRTRSGEPYVTSSVDASTTLEMLSAAPDEIGRMAKED